MLKVGFVSYINALPLNAAFRLKKIKNDFKFTFDIPSKLNQMLKEGELDIALTSSVLALNEGYKTLPDFCIASNREILSVNLYLKESLSLDQAKIALTHHSETSISLLNTLCHHHWNINPTFIPLDPLEPLENYEAFLLIGDEALEKRYIRGYETFDLGKAWHKMTSLPFVFALFSIRKGIQQEKIDLFSQALKDAYHWGEHHFEDIICLATNQSSLPESIIRNYYQACQYHLGDKEKKGLESFEKYRNLSKVGA